MAKFKQFEIRKPTVLCQKPDDYFEYNFDLVKWNEDNKTCFSIALLVWDIKEYGFDFESVGTRYLEYREDGLEEWLLAWGQMKKVEFMYKEKE